MRRNQERNFVQFTPIPMTYTELLPHLLQKRLVAICPMKPMQPPFPKNYDPNAKCDYHGGGVGHSTEKCVTLKHKVEALINSGWVKFHKDKPSVEANPLSGHGNHLTNAIEDREHKLVKNVSEIRSSKRFIFETCRSDPVSPRRDLQNQARFTLELSLRQRALILSEVLSRSRERRTPKRERMEAW